MDDIIAANSISTSDNGLPILKYPIFTDSAQYMKCRDGGKVWVHFKRWFEHRAIDHCLSDVGELRTVVDIPCGPGRLFPYWHKRGAKVMGIDLSGPMIEAAGQKMAELGLDGFVIKGDAFRLKKHIYDRPDVVASVRFIYYFNRAQRIDLMRSLADIASAYLLLQYKTIETYKGRRNARRAMKKPNPLSKRFCTYSEITEEVREAGLICRRIESIGVFSDRVFVLAQKGKLYASGNYRQTCGN